MTKEFIISMACSFSFIFPCYENAEICKCCLNFRGVLFNFFIIIYSIL